MEPKNWKDTLLMPQTDFEMKANLVTKEKKYHDYWIKNKIYEQSLAKNKTHEQFILHDGPPYANGDLHMGHALNKILKDIIVRRKHMEGFYSPYVPGWDTHGLPIENKMLELSNKTKDDFDPLALRKEAAKYALRQVESQKKQFEQMSLFSDFNNAYITLNKEYETKQLQVFKKLCMDGLIYKGLKPVYWSPSSQSALAEAEVEYKDHVSPQIIVAFSVTRGNGFVDVGDNLLIMTTTPWTLIANSGVAVGNDISYVLVEASGKKYVIAKALVDNIKELAKWDDVKIVDEFKGKDLVGIEYARPVKKDLTAPVVLGHHVSTNEGTGLVHLAPLFGEDDYIIGKESNLDMIMHVESDGMLNGEANEYANKFYADANKDIGMAIDKEGKLISLKFQKHSYPHDWRTHKPVIYRGVPQWFANVKKIKPQILNALDDVKFYTSWGKSRFSRMLENRNEWTISRQRTWGVPIIIFYDKHDEPIYNESLFDHVINLVSKHGTDIWWEKDTEDLLPEEFKNQGLTKEMDIMDVWFDSGVSFAGAQIKDAKLPYDLYLEGNDQFRGWFNSSIINSVAYFGYSPYKNLVSHGFVLDGKQNKMSKSKGNIISPLDIISKNGADVLRLWVANSEYTSDVSYSEDILKQNIEIYRRIRNSFKFMLGNLFDFDFEKDQVKLKNMHQFIYEKIINYQNKMIDLYNDFKFQEIIQETNKLLIDLSGWYFSQAKDSLYCDKFNGVERRSIQTNIYHIINVMVKILAPILPTTMEEIYEHYAGDNKLASIFLDRVDVAKQEVKQDDFAHNFENDYRKKANKVLEEAIKNGGIKRTNEAILTVNFNEKDQNVISLELLAKYFLVAKVNFGDKWAVSAFDSEKCHRCWNHFSKSDLSKEMICDRCYKVVNLL